MNRSKIDPIKQLQVLFMIRIEQLSHKSKDLRKVLFKVCCSNGGHIASALSCLDILVSLYYSGLFKFKPETPNWEDRDWFFLSKGHAELALYCILADLHFFPKDWLITRYRTGDCFLGGHPDIRIPGVEITSGALGHGLGIAAGVALASKKDQIVCNNYVLLGDAECTEGSIWEAALFASFHKLNNLVAIIDRNHRSALDCTENFCALDPLEKKWEAFGWEVKIINGHDFNQLIDVLAYLNSSQRKKPFVIIAETVKGKGISFLENDPMCHMKGAFSDHEIHLANCELEIV